MEKSSKSWSERKLESFRGRSKKLLKWRDPEGGIEKLEKRGEGRKIKKAKTRDTKNRTNRKRSRQYGNEAKNTRSRRKKMQKTGRKLR